MTRLEQGDIIVVDFGDAPGLEDSRGMYALVVSNEDFNSSTGMTLVCPITTSRSRFFLYDALPEDCAIQGSVVMPQLVAIDLESRPFRKLDELHGKPLDDILACVRSFF